MGDHGGRRSVALAAMAALVAALLTPISGAAANSPVPKRISTEPFALVQTATPTAALAALVETAGTLTLPAVMPNGDLRRQPLCHRDVLAALDRPLHGFCWEPEDDRDCHEMPQGITTTKDAYGRAYPGPHYVITSWYYRHDCGDNANDRAHITITNWGAPLPNRYVKVLLVEPRLTKSGRASFKDIATVNVHAGGVAWFRNHLYLADTTGGFRIFDVNQMVRVDPGLAGIGRRAGGGYAAHGFRYVLPQVASTRQVGRADFRFSTIGLDHTGPSIVAAEYDRRADQRGSDGSLAARFDLNPLTGRLVADRDGLIRPTKAWRTRFAGVNGVVAYDGHWWFASSSKARLYSWSPARGTVRAHRWTTLVEGLSYWPDRRGPDLLWNLREEVGGKNVFAVQQRHYN